MWEGHDLVPEGLVCPQAQTQELEELNRELRQCNLQQFIQQTGAALPPPPQLDRTIPSTQVRVVLGRGNSGGLP